MCENEADSEDDFEGYFLKPVNEYNIVDRIKDANKELFATPQPPSPSSILNRKVTFRDVLEDYEPSLHEESIVADHAVMEAIPQESDEIEFLDNNNRNGCDLSKRCENSLKLASSVSMSDSSDHEIEEIGEEISCLEIHETTSDDCEDNLDTEVENPTDKEEPPPSPDEESFPQASPTPKQSESLEDSSTNYSQSSDETPSIIRPPSPEQQKPETTQLLDDTTSSTTTLRPRISSAKIAKDRSKLKPKSEYSSDIMKLRLNYKTCCEYKNAIDNLPRYSGYFSTYGLSKEQWDRRDKRLERNRKKMLDKSQKFCEETDKKMEDNERAFTSWLRNKMRFPINKTKNMFDFKPIRLRRKKKNE